MLKYCFPCVALFAIVGCAGPVAHVTDPGQPTLAEGYMAVSDAESGVSMAYPTNWQPGQYPSISASMDMSQSEPGAPDPNDAFKELGNSLKKEEAKMSAREQESLRKEGIVLMFNDGSRPIPGEENTRLYFQIKEEMRGLDDAAGEFAKLMIFPTKTPTETPIGKCIRLNSDYTSKGGDRIHEIAYVWADGTKGYALRFICTGEKQPIASIAEPVMQTVRIRPAKA